MMSHPAPPTSAAARPNAATVTKRRPRLLKCIIISILTIIALIGLAVLIVWLAIRPKNPVYTVEDGKVSDFNLQNNHLNGTFDFKLRAYNPNDKISMYYDTIEVSVAYDDQTLAFDIVDPFFQPHGSVKHLEAKPMVRSVPLLGSVAKDIGREKSVGDQIELRVLVKAKIRYKLGIWKSKHYKLKVYCSSVVVHLHSSKKFEAKYCDVDT